jgi:hypothetical protein
MVKVLNNEVARSQDQGKKQRNKQAKREAKMMLKLEQARQDVQKAEQKVAKAQARLEARRTHLHTLENQMTEMRSAHQEAEASTPDTGFDNQQGQPKAVGEASDTAWQETSSYDGHSIPVPTAQEESLPPAEGRRDIGEGEPATRSAENSGSVPTSTDPEVSLPPAEGRTDIGGGETASSSEE